MWVLIGLALLLGLLALAGDRERARYATAQLAERLRDAECPRATVIVPVKGYDEGLAANLAALATLDYPDYELIVVARAVGDIPEGCLPASAQLLFAGEGDAATGEKINNLLAAVRAARLESQLFAFADSDGQVRRTWLRALAAPLRDPGVGASTGYRWHIPTRAGFWPIMRSAWNAVIAGGLRFTASRIRERLSKYYSRHRRAPPKQRTPGKLTIGNGRAKGPSSLWTTKNRSVRSRPG